MVKLFATALLALCGLFWFAAQVHAAEGATAVFAASTTYSLNPDGTVLEVAGNDFGDLRKQNGHWDGASKTVKLYGARNEDAAVQILIPRAGPGYTAVLSELKGPGTIAVDRASFFARGWAKTTTGFVHDLIIPLDGSVKGIKTFDIPQAWDGFPKPANTVGSLLVEVWIPNDAKPGQYTGTLEIKAGTESVEKLNVALTVFDLALPDQPTFALDLLTYGMPSEALKLGGYLNGQGVGKPAQPMSEKGKQVDHQAYKLAADNRAFINVLPYSSQRGNPRYAYPVKGQGAAAEIMSFKEYDDLFGPILDGKCSKFGAPPAHFTLAFNVNYPHVCDGEVKNQFNWIPFKDTIPEGPNQNPKLKEFEETNKAIAEATAKHFAEKGWTKTRFEIYHNQKANPERNRLPWKLDEPTDGSHYKALRYMLNVGKWAFASAAEQGVKVVTRIDIGHFHCDKMCSPEGKIVSCYKAKQYDTHHAQETLTEAVDHWVIGSTHAAGAQQMIKAYEGPGKKMMSYGTAVGGLSTHLGGFRGSTYRLARMGMCGLILYRLGPCDPNNWNVADDDATLYSGVSAGYEGLIASHRLKLWRDAVNDYDYMVQARAKNAAAVDALLDKMVRVAISSDEKYRTQTGSRDFYVNNNVEDFLRAKLQLAALISGQSPPEGIELEPFSKKFTPIVAKDGIVGYD